MRDILLSKETRYMKDYDFTNLKQNMHFDIENRSPYIQMTEALNNSRMNGDYENTIGENKEESISQAIDIALREMRSAEQSMREQIYRPEVNLKKGIWLAVLMIAVMVVWIIFSKRLTFYVPFKRYQIILALVVIYISLVSIFAKSFAAKGGAMEEGRDQAVFYRDVVKADMDALRAPVDKLEMIVDKDMWPMPSYGDLIFEV